MEYKLLPFDLPLRVSRIANVHYFEFTRQYHTFDDAHNFCELLYVDRGSISVHAENYSGILSDNQLLIHRPNEKHSLECNDTICPNVAILGFEADAEALEFFSHSPVTLQPRHKNLFSRIMVEGMNVFSPPYDVPYTLEMKKREDAPFGSEQMLQICLETFLITLVRDFHTTVAVTQGRTSPNTKLSDIYDYISQHYTERFSLDDICFLFGTNKTTLCQSFKEEYGITVLNYINQLKIKDAKTFLREQKLSITEISETLGFSSIHYFCRLFKKHTNMSPKEYVSSIKSRLNL
jgi:AraC-like DNA-binding protein